MHSPLDHDGNTMLPNKLVAFLDLYEWDMPLCFSSLHDNGITKPVKLFTLKSEKSECIGELCLVCEDASCTYFSTMYFLSILTSSAHN
jgi:hypothetical protein